MRFALLGDHPDGLDFARALAESGRHTLAVYSGPPVGAEYLRRWGLEFRRVGELVREGGDGPEGRPGDGVMEATKRAAPARPPGPPASPAPQLIEMERWSPEPVLLDAQTAGHKPSLPGWDVLRALAGEI